MAIRSKSVIKRELLQSGERLVKVRQAAELTRDLINQSEPEAIRTAQSQINPGSPIQGDNKR